MSVNQALDDAHVLGDGAPPPVTDLDLRLACNPVVITGITAPIDPARLGTSIDATVAFSDPDPGDTHTATWTWGDGTTTSGSASPPSATASHQYAAEGVYTVFVIVTDALGQSDSADSQYVVVYDPDAGFVTGGGWINSPADAYAANPSLTGKATFGFASKYVKGANVPGGNTEFQFKAAALNHRREDELRGQGIALRVRVG